MQTESLLQPTSSAPLASLPPIPERLSTEIDTVLKNRRGSTRYTAVKDSLWAGWWVDGEFVLSVAQLVNISEGGVLIYTEKAPLQDQVVWMRLEGTSAQKSLAARVLESRWVTLRRRWVVRLEFEQTCPTDFYESAVFGS